MNRPVATCLSLGVSLLLMATCATASQAKTIKGHLEHQQEDDSTNQSGDPGRIPASSTITTQPLQPNSGMFQGQLVDGATGKPLQGATVTIPDRGFHGSTNQYGQYQVPKGLMSPSQPMIMSIQKDGYAPFSVTISQNKQPPFRMQLQQLGHGVVLDNTLRHLGDGSFSASSNNAGDFRKGTDGIGLRIPFQLKGTSGNKEPHIVIGSILGLDTMMAHVLSGNNMGVSASPLQVKVNGRLVATIQVNGDSQRIRLPSGALNYNGDNILEIETGFQVKDSDFFSGQIQYDYDDMELMHIVIYP